MKGSITINVRHIVLAIGVCAALFVAYTLGSGPQSAHAADDEAAATTDTRRIVMTASGSATGVPDQVSFRLSVDAHASDISAGLKKTNSTLRRVLLALQDQGVPRSDTQTTGLSIRPTYDYSGSGSPTITGYAVSEDVSVLIREISGSGKVLSAAVAAGGNAVSVHDLKLKIGDEDALVEKARDDAVKQATDKAKQYAEASGASLGDVISIKEVSANPRVYARQLAFSAADSAQVLKGHIPIRAGEADLKVSVSIVWSLD